MPSPPPAPPRRARPFTLSNPPFLAFKASAATLLAMLSSEAIGNPDLVSATFVAVLCCSPAVSLGGHQASVQLTGSLIGGVSGSLARALGAPALIGVPAAVGASIGAAFLLGLPGGYPVAAFTALFVQLVTFGGPLETLGVRMLAVVLAALCGVVVNLIVSGFFYSRVFRVRLRKLEAHLAARLRAAATEGPDALTPAAAPLAELTAQLTTTLRELSLRRAPRTLARLLPIRARVAAWSRLVHHARSLALDADDAADAGDVEAPTSARALMRWLANPDAPPPTPAPPLAASAARLIAARRALDALDAPHDLPGAATPGAH